MIKQKMIYESIVIGGGAAGMMCAVRLAIGGVKTAVIEKNQILGKKLRITGKGRCNVTNACSKSILLENIIGDKKFLMSAFSKFNSMDTMDFFENAGVPLKIERGKRVFPISDKARDIADCLARQMKNSGVKTIFDEVVNIYKDEDDFQIQLKSGDVIASKNVVIATGGKSYQSTGSTGDGYKFAKNFGHNVTELRPCLVPIEVEEMGLCQNMMGLSLKNVTVKLFENRKEVYSELGEMLFAHFGLTGPLILSSSAYITDTKNKSYTIEINCKPGLTEEMLDARILRDFNESPNRIISNVLKSLLPSKMILPIIKLSGIDSEKQVNSITRKERMSLEHNISHLTFTVKGLRPIDEGIITAGGVDVKEIEPKNMESKLCKGLYFIGEVLDQQAYTGGFNLQIAFSTAVVCADDIVKKYGKEGVIN